MPTGGAVKLTIDSDKVGYVRLPNGGILTTVAGVIDTTYSGVGGAITYYVPKTSVVLIATVSGLSGNIVYNGASDLYVFDNFGLTSLVANETGYVNTANNTDQTSIIANKAVEVIATNNALTAKSIGDILYAAYIDNREDVVYDFSGGTNADDTAIEAYLNATYGIASILTIIDALNALGGTITYNSI